MTKHIRQKNERMGHFAEYFAIFFLSLFGYRYLKLRQKTPFGEIDLIFKKGDIIIFCEVKYRKNKNELLYSVTEHQKMRIKRAAEFWLSENGCDNYDVRFDFIGLTVWRKPLHIKNAF